MQFWSNTENHCALPGCESAAVTLPGGYQYAEVTVDYTLRLSSGQAYDPLYRLTTADYSTGDYYHYAYDSVGNRLTQESLVSGLTTTNEYAYDIANRLVDVDGIPYTWDANGNLLNDGVNTYTYDAANRLVEVSNQSTVSSYQYNGLGDRLSQNGAQYTLDLNSGLTQVLSDGATSYTYGLGRISQQAGSTTEYFLGDALGSVRQLTDQAGAVTFAQGYDPYGVVTLTKGAAQSAYGFTGEAYDSSAALLYLRARWYSPGISRFISRDPSGLEANIYLYANANPINRTDRTGLMTGLEAFARCFNIHSLSQVTNNSGLTNGTSAQEAVDICRLAYSRDAWASMPFGSTPDSAHNLFGMYINESSTNNRIIFTYKDALTKELSGSVPLLNLRREYLQSGDTTGPREWQFNVQEQAGCITDYNPWDGVHNLLSLPLTCFLGSFYYQIKTVNTYKGTYVGFRIDNRTDLESGTHIALRFPGNNIGGSVEELIDNKQIIGNEPIWKVMNTKYGNKFVVSILRARSSAETNWYSSSLGSHELGGGNMTQTYVWMEKYDPCDPLSKFGFYWNRWHEVEEWINWYPPSTQPILQWNEAF